VLSVSPSPEATNLHSDPTIMFKTGQQVVCINDEFDPWVYDLYRALPKKNRIYKVRAVGVGRSNPTFVVNDDAEIKLSGAEFDLLLLLEELRNPDDPHSSVKQELGFRSERFAPLDEEEEEEEEFELVGTGKAAESWEPATKPG
jgi:hypothetical protein